MGPRVALTNQLEPQVFEVISSFLEPEYVPFNTARGGLHRNMSNEVQKMILDYAQRPYPPFAEWVYNPMIDLEALREFGEWCRDGCPVTVGSEVYRYWYGSHHTGASSSSQADSRRVVHHI